MYIKLQKEKMVFVDVDDTLITWDPEKYPHNPDDLITFTDEYGQWNLLPHKKNIEFVINLKRQGYGVVVWSAAGASWAETIVNRLGLENVADMIISKPEIAIDDLLDAKRIIKTVLWIDPVSGEFKRNG